MTAGYTAIVPVKRYRRAKSRLALPSQQREGLAQAFALHVVTAALDAEQVAAVVLVGEGSAVARRADVIVIPDPGSLPGAVEAGRRWALDRRPHAPVAVVPADLPALTSRRLDTALAAARGHQAAFWADHQGSGTTLLTASGPGKLVAAYGGASAARHRELGAIAMPGAWPGVRDDVDTLDDLERVGELGVGPGVARLIATQGIAPAARSLPA